MRKLSLCALSVWFVGLAMATDPLVTVGHGNVVLTSGGTVSAGNYPEVWNLRSCSLKLKATVDLTGMIDDFAGAAHAWSELGIRELGAPNFNPGTWSTGGKGVWLATDYDWAANTFDPDPGSPNLDLDDKMILQRGGGADESHYNLPTPPSNPWANYGVWYDRDGVDPWQALDWGAINGGTYNTAGRYNVEIDLAATSPTSGQAYLTVNSVVKQGFFQPNWHSGAPDLYPAGMTFSGDMTQQQIFYGLFGYGATHTVKFENVTVTGCVTADSGKELCKEGGWKTFQNPSFKNQGDCVSFFSTQKH